MSKIARRREAEYERAQQDREVLQLVLAGATFADIARRIGYATPSGAYRAYKRALAADVRPLAEEVRDLELRRLDKMMTRWYSRAVGDPQRGIDPSPRATEMVLKIMQRRAALLGLDADEPTQQRVTLEVSWGRPDPALSPEPIVLEGESWPAEVEAP